MNEQPATGERWTLENANVRCTVFFDGTDLVWTLASHSPSGFALEPVNVPTLSVDGEPLRYESVVETHTARSNGGTEALSVVLRAQGGKIEVTRWFELFGNQPFVRLSGSLKHRGTQPSMITDCAIADLRLAGREAPTLFHVEQFSWVYRRDFFTQNQVPLVTGRAPIEVRMGSFPSFFNAPTSCGWFALRQGPPDVAGETPRGAAGLVAGIEFNGKSRLRAWKDRDLTMLVSTVDELRHVLNPGDTFEIPAFFVGMYDGDWDEAAYVTQRFAESHVHPPMPDERYPWIQYNSWAYGQDIDAAQQLAAIERCAELGVEVIVLDLGWSKRIGEWRHDAAKFPEGLRPLADRARELGLRFGVHIAYAQAAPDAPIIQEHPDWLIHDDNDYFGAGPLCLGHVPCRDWLIEHLAGMIEEYGIDYIIQDGEDMVKRCDAATHSHAPGDSNYANSTLGLDIVVGTLAARFPHVVWENCEDGGCMMTYRMARMYHSSITVDNIGTYATRQGIYGASYPFSPRYSVRYMQDAPTTYTLRSAIFGGPLILMHRVTDWSAEEMAETGAAIQVYKDVRTLIRDAKIVHLLPPLNNAEGTGRGWDAIQAVSPDQQRSVVMVYRAAGDTPNKTIKPRGLRGDGTYRVSFKDRDDHLHMSGAELADMGIDVSLPELSSEIISIEA